MPASRRVSLKDREDRDRSVRRALGAFLTPPQAEEGAPGPQAAAQASVGPHDPSVLDVTDDTHDTAGSDVTHVTDVADALDDMQAMQEMQEMQGMQGMDETAHPADPAAPGPSPTPRRAPRGRVVTAQPDALSDARRFDAPASFVLKGRRFDPPAGARKRQNYALSAETIKRIALASAYAGVGKAELVDAVLCAALRDLLGE